MRCPCPSNDVFAVIDAKPDWVEVRLVDSKVGEKWAEDITDGWREAVGSTCWGKE